jgi:metal-sulfur cluster biosynthetic enzyme
MNDEREQPKAVNPHTGQPVPSDAAPIEALPGEAVASNAAAPSGGETPAAEPTPATEAAPAGETSAPSVQELAMRSAFETVMDPEIGLSVVDLGLIREVSVQPGKTHVKMMLTTPFCPYAPQLMADVKSAAMSVVEQETEVEILPDAWSPELMPDPGLLGYSF